MIASEPKQYASDSDRWYDPKTQQSVNDCLAKNGNPKKVDLREARKHGYIPSVTTVLGIISKPGLEKWKKEQVAKVSLEVASEYSFYWGERCDGLLDQEILEESLRRSELRMSQARELGTKIHGEIDQWLLAEVQTPYSLRTEAIVRAFKEAGVAGQRMVVESPFVAQVEGMWIAGKSDLYFPEAEVIFDWKSSKEACDESERMGFDEHLIQMSAYSMALFGKFVDCRNCFISTSVEGNVQVRAWSPEELSRGWEMYRAAYRLWTLSKNYLVSDSRAGVFS